MMLKFFDKLRFRVRERIARRVRVFDGDYWLKFRCDTPIESWRARTLPTKETGTNAWIRREVHAGDVFVDVGANIGLYTIMAAKRVGPCGLVYAFEPHLGNAFSLLRNCLWNDALGIVRVVTSALDNEERYSEFNYVRWLPGSSHSQFDRRVDDQGRPFEPVFSELKHGVSFDSLVETGVVRLPTLIKIDVDGNEPRVLSGMRKTLASPMLRSIQVEVGPQNSAAVKAMMSQAGYVVRERHDTDAGKRRIDAGAPPDSVAHNLIFERDKHGARDGRR